MISFGLLLFMAKSLSELLFYFTYFRCLLMKNSPIFCIFES